MAGHYINRATFCSLAIAFYLYLLSYSSISVALASPYPGQYSMNDRLIEREPLPACSAVKGEHIECKPNAGINPSLSSQIANDLRSKSTLGTGIKNQGSTKTTTPQKMRRRNNRLGRREPLVACSAVKGLHVACSPDGSSSKKPDLNVFSNKGTVAPGATKKVVRNIQRRKNNLLFERAPSPLEYWER